MKLKKIFTFIFLFTCILLIIFHSRIYAQVNSTSSYLRIHQSHQGAPRADGLTPCTVTVCIASETDAPLLGFEVTVYTSRGLFYDTIVYPYGQITDSNGICTAAITSSYLGSDTVTALCEGVTITENILNNSSFETGTTNPANWIFTNPADGLWTWMSDTVYLGVRSIQNTATVGGDRFAEARWTDTPFNNKWPITGSSTFYAGQYCKTQNIAGGNASIRIVWWSDTGSLGSVYPSSLSGTNEWTLMEGTLTSPSKTVGLSYRCQQSGTGTAWFDTVRLRRVPTLNWTASNIKIATVPFATTVNAPSSAIVIYVQDSVGNTDTGFNNTVTLSSSSADGKFSVARGDWVDTSIITLSGGSGTVYYKDSSIGNPVITASRVGYTSDTQTETILTQDVNETASYITFTPYQIAASGVNSATTVVTINDTYGFPIVNKLTTLQTTNGNSDTINDSVGGSVNPQTTDVNGVCTFTVKSNYSGWDTITATVDGKTITRGVNKYGAVGIWHFDTDVKDVSGYGNNAIMGGNTAPLWTSVPDSAAQGCALQFDGINDYLEIPKSSGLSIDEAITIELWVKQAKSNVSGSLIFSGAGGSDYGIWMNGSKFIAGFWNTISTQYSPNSTIIPATGKWYHLAVTYDSNNDTIVRLYVDGTLNNTVSATGKIKTTSTTLTIGGKYPNSWYFNGIIDEIKIYNRALSPAEIKANYDRRANIYFTPNTLKITSPQRTTGAGVVSDSLTVDVQDGVGTKDTTFTNTITLVSSSVTGRFSSDGINWSGTSDTFITFVQGYGAIYYRDTTVGTPTITVSRSGYISDAQLIVVTQSVIAETTSFLYVSDATPFADGASRCSVTITIKDEYGRPIYGRYVTIVTSRGSNYDTITQPFTTTDANGQCTGSIVSPYSGGDTITALCDGCTILENIIPNPSFEEGEGINPQYWSRAQPTGSWIWITGVARSGNKSIRHYTDTSADNYYRNDKRTVYPNSTYCVSFWMKTDSYSDTAFVRFIRYQNGTFCSPPSIYVYTLSGTNDWTYIVGTVSTPSDARSTQLSCDARRTGTIWYDCVRVRRVPTINWSACKMVIVTPQRTVAAGSISDSIVVEARDAMDNKDTNYAETVSLVSSSAQGKFSVSSSFWSDTTILTFVNGEITFYYRDIVPDSPVITVLKQGVQSDTQIVNVTPAGFSESTSYLKVNPISVVANGISKCTVTVWIKDILDNPVFGKQVTIVSSRNAYDTITQPALTDVNGMCTGFIVSSRLGQDTITALCDGETVTNLFSDIFENSDAWTSVSGTWNIESGEYSGQYTGNPGTYITDRTFSNFTLVFDYTCINTSTADAWAGVQIRKTGPADNISTSGYLIYYRSNPSDQITLYKLASPVKASINAPDPTIKRNVRIEAYEYNIKVYIDNVLYINWTDNEPNSFVSGYISLNISNTHAHYDNFRIYPANITWTASKLKFVSDAFSVKAGESSPQITVIAVDEMGDTDTDFSETVTLSASSESGCFSGDNVVWSNPGIDTFVVLASGKGVFYYLDYRSGKPMITVSRLGLQFDTQIETVTASKLEIVSDSFTMSAVEISPPITIAAKDEIGNTDTYFGDTVILSSTSPRGRFSVSSSPWSDTTVIWLSSGKRTMYCKDSKGGSHIITAYSPKIAAADTQVYSIIQPRMDVTKIVRNLRVGEESLVVEGISGDTLEFIITIQNTGNETAIDLVIIDTFAFDTDVYSPVEYVTIDTSAADTWAYTLDPISAEWVTGVPTTGMNVKGLRWVFNALGSGGQQKQGKFRVRIK